MSGAFFIVLKTMKVPTFTLFTLFCCNLFANEIHTYDFVKVLNGNQSEALYYYQNNWQKLREEAVKQSYIKGFSVLQTGNKAEYDLALVTVYASEKQFSQREANFQKLIDARGELALLNDKKPADFRKVVGEADFTLVSHQ